MSRGYKKKSWKKLVFIGLTFTMLIAIFIAVYEYRVLIDCEEKNNVLELQLQSYQKLVYVAAERLPKGTVITEEKLNKEIRYSDLPLENYISTEDIGKTLLVDAEQGICLTHNMLYADEKDVREIFINDVELTEYLETGDRVDIRLRYPNAEEYIVLSDKILLKCEPASGIVLELTEEELLMLSSAIADCSIYEKTKLYAVEYPDYPQLNTGITNYIANKVILKMLGKETLKGESRIALEQRLEQCKQ